MVYQIADSDSVNPKDVLDSLELKVLPKLPEGKLAYLIGYGLPYSAKSDLNLVKGLKIEDFWSRKLIDPAYRSLVGIVGMEGHGLSGVEYALDSLILAGKHGYRYAYRTADGRLMFGVDLPQNPPVDGGDIWLTIDADIQAFCYEQLKMWVESHDALHGMVIVADPNTGELLAVVNYPDNGDYAVTDPYEPGSTFKIVAHSYAYEHKIIHPEDSIDTGEGFIDFKKHRIRDVHPLGKITWRDALVHSSNVATSKLALKLGAHALVDQALKFGFLAPTGVILSGESYSPPRDSIAGWDSVTVAGFSIGQGLLVNGIQMVMAYSAIANGGYLLMPKLIRAYEKDGKIVKTPSRIVVRKVLNRSTDSLLTEILVEVVDSGTGRLARVPNVKVAGKTGTAQKFDKKTGRYSWTRVTGSFIGFFPADEPKYIVYVVIDEPHKGSSYGGYIAAPLFRKIALWLLTRETFRM